MQNETLITIEQAAQLVPSKPTPNAVWRWMRRGVRARNGTLVLLEHRRYGGKLFTSKEALDRFSISLADADAKHFERIPFTPVADVPARSCASRDREIAAAKRRVKAAGI